MHVRTLEIAHSVDVEGRPDEPDSPVVSGLGDWLWIALIKMPNLRAISLADTGGLFDTWPDIL